MTAEIRELIADLDAYEGLDTLNEICGRSKQALTELLARVERLEGLVREAYEEGWHEGYATGDAGGRYSTRKDDWEGSNARAALGGE